MNREDLSCFCSLQKANGFVVYLRAVGGESASPAALAPKVGPLGMVFVIKRSNNLLGP